jgi:hypothetical protein
MWFMKMCGNMIFAFCTIVVAVTSPTLGADNPFDGIYSGTRTLTKGSYESCPKVEEMSITVQGGKFTFTNSFSRALLAVVKIGSDGSFSSIHQGGVAGSWYISGKIARGVLEAEANSSACLHHWSLKKK